MLWARWSWVVVNHRTSGCSSTSSWCCAGGGKLPGSTWGHDSNRARPDASRHSQETRARRRCARSCRPICATRELGPRALEQVADQVDPLDRAGGPCRPSSSPTRRTHLCVWRVSSRAVRIDGAHRCRPSGPRSGGRGSWRRSCLYDARFGVDCSAPSPACRWRLSSAWCRADRQATTVAPTAKRVPQTAAGPIDVPEVLAGRPVAASPPRGPHALLGHAGCARHPVGNFPSFRGPRRRAAPAHGNNPNRGLSTLARGVYGYSLAFMLTGEERYLGLREGRDRLDRGEGEGPRQRRLLRRSWMRRRAGRRRWRTRRSSTWPRSGWRTACTSTSRATRRSRQSCSRCATCCSTKYYDPVGNRVKDALTYDLATEVDLGANGGDITNLLVPGTALLLPNAELLTDPARRAQFRDDLRSVTDSLIARHKNTDVDHRPVVVLGTHAAVRQLRRAPDRLRPQHQVLRDDPQRQPGVPRPAVVRRWPPTGTTLLTRAWDDEGRALERAAAQLRCRAPSSATARGGCTPRPTRRWRPSTSPTASPTRPSSPRSAQSFLDVFVDDESPARETFAGIARVGDRRPTSASRFFGKNMLHAHEHALIMYLHGRALEGRPARLYYAFPEDEALTAVAKPYWFDAAPGGSRGPGRPGVAARADGSSRSSSPASTPYPRRRSPHRTTSRHPRPSPRSSRGRARPAGTAATSP